METSATTLLSRAKLTEWISRLLDEPKNKKEEHEQEKLKHTFQNSPDELIRKTGDSSREFKEKVTAVVIALSQPADRVAKGLLLIAKILGEEIAQISGAHAGAIAGPTGSVLSEDPFARLSLRDAARLDRITREFAKAFASLRKDVPYVAIFGSARTTPDDPDYQAARKLGYLLALNNFGVITGGGPGIMEAALLGAKEAGGKDAVGLLIELPRAQLANPYVQHAINFNFFFARKVAFLLHTVGASVYPGGFGTLDEMYETLTLLQTGKQTPPIPVVLNNSDYWNGLLEWTKKRVLASGKIDPKDMELFRLAETPEENLQIFTSCCRPQRGSLRQ